MLEVLQNGGFARLLTFTEGKSNGEPQPRFAAKTYSKSEHNYSMLNMPCNLGRPNYKHSGNFRLLAFPLQRLF